MTINWMQEITDFEDKPINVEDNVQLTLGRAAIIALTVQTQADQEMSGEDRFKLGRIASKIADNKDLAVDELATVKERIGKFYVPTVVYKTWNMIDPNNENK